MINPADNDDTKAPTPLESALTRPLNPEQTAGVEPPPAEPTSSVETLSTPELTQAPAREDPVLRPPGLQALSEETAMLYELVGEPHILSVVVLIGASALLPVPFLDDVAKAYLERRLVRTIASGEKLTLTTEEVERLTLEPPKGCCALGCLGKVVLYPIKKLIRKILFFLEIKRAVDQSSNALAEAWLLTLALRQGLWSTGRPIAEADRLREVMDAACQSHGVKPLETAFDHAFRGAKVSLLDFAGRFTGQVDDDKERLDAAVEKLEAEEGERLAKLSRKLREALSEVGEVYLQRFAKEFERQMEEAVKRPPSPSKS